MKRSTALKISMAVAAPFIPAVYSIVVPIRIVRDTVVMIKDCIEAPKDAYDALCYFYECMDDASNNIYGKSLFENDDEETISFEEAKEAYFELRKETGV